MTAWKPSKLQRLGFGPIHDPRARGFQKVLHELVNEPSLLGRQKLMDEFGPLYEDEMEEIVNWSIEIDRAREMKRRREQRKPPSGKNAVKERIRAEAKFLLSSNRKLSENSVADLIFKARKQRSPSQKTIRRWISEG